MTDETSRQPDENLTLDNPEVKLAKALEHLRIMLAAEMKDLRINKRDLTQQQVADELGLNQSRISKIESSTHNTRIEYILKYLKALDAEFVVGIHDGEEFLPVSEAAEGWWESIVERVRTTDEDDADPGEERGNKIAQLEEKYGEELTEDSDRVRSGKQESSSSDDLQWAG